MSLQGINQCLRFFCIEIFTEEGKPLRDILLVKFDQTWPAAPKLAQTCHVLSCTFPQFITHKFNLQTENAFVQSDRTLLSPLITVEGSSNLSFFYEVSHQLKETSEDATCSWVWSGIPNQVQLSKICHRFFGLMCGAQTGEGSSK